MKDSPHLAKNPTPMGCPTLFPRRPGRRAEAPRRLRLPFFFPSGKPEAVRFELH